MPGTRSSLTTNSTGSKGELLEALPRPPVTAEARVSNVWIVEWLPIGDRRTGKALHDWLHERRHGWSIYSSCQNKDEVLVAISHAAERAQRTGISPVLHIEAHGGELGLEGPNRQGNTEFLAWDALTGPLQNLNRATKCNLVVFVAACTGIAGIQALTRGPVAPAVALVGPCSEVAPRDLLEGQKEFYRRCMDDMPQLVDALESASNEIGTVVFEYESVVVLAYETFVEDLLKRLRQTTNEGAIDVQNTPTDNFPSSHVLQTIWDEMFMIDIYPENQKHFGVDWNTIVKLLTELSTPCQPG